MWVPVVIPVPRADHGFLLGGQPRPPFRARLPLAVGLDARSEFPGQGERPSAGVGDRAAVARHVVAVARGALRPAFLPAYLGRLHLSLAAGAELLMSPRAGLLRREEEFLERGPQ